MHCMHITKYMFFIFSRLIMYASSTNVCGEAVGYKSTPVKRSSATSDGVTWGKCVINSWISYRFSTTVWRKEKKVFREIEMYCLGALSSGSEFSERQSLDSKLCAPSSKEPLTAESAQIRRASSSPLTLAPLWSSEFRDFPRTVKGSWEFIWLACRYITILRREQPFVTLND